MNNPRTLPKKASSRLHHKTILIIFIINKSKVLNNKGSAGLISLIIVIAHWHRNASFFLSRCIRVGSEFASLFFVSRRWCSRSECGCLWVAPSRRSAQRWGVKFWPKGAQVRKMSDIVGPLTIFLVQLRRVKAVSFRIAELHLTIGDRITYTSHSK